jgi:predicted phosphohydrolase
VSEKQACSFKQASNGMQIIWVTDPHLNFARHDVWEAWINSIRLVAGDCLLITGDISESDDIAWQLQRIQESISVPLYFVLGNHDYYGSRVEVVRNEMRALTDERPACIYLNQGNLVSLEDDWVLVGNDGWADGGFGDALSSPVRLNDFKRIKDYGGLDLMTDLEIMKDLALQCSSGLRETLDRACQQSQRILVATHVPPFREACWYEGQITDDDWAPYFVSRVMGETLLEFAGKYREHLFHVLCGHTHHAGTARLRENLTVWTGAAEYGRPSIQDVIDTHSLADQLRGR